MDLKASQWRPGQNVCRCCLTEGCYKDISSEYFWMGKREVYTEMLSDCFGVTICQTPPISSTSVSRLICDDCVSRLRDASNFKRQVLDCEKMFKQYLEPAVDETGIEFSADLLKVKRESVKTEIDEADDSLDQNVEYLEDDAFDDLDDEPLTKLASKTKKESVDIMDLLDNEKFSKAPEPKAAIKRKSTIIVKATPPKKSKPQKVVKAAEPTTSSSIKDDKKKGAKRQVTQQQYQNNGVAEKDKKAAMKNNLLIVLENSTVCPFRRLNNFYGCFYCNTKFFDITSLREHTKELHINTIEAFEKLRWYHKHVKVEITDLECKLCDSQFKDIVSIKEHLENIHEKGIDFKVSDYLIAYKINTDSYECHICEKKINSFRNLSHHLNEHYRNYICDICAAPFSEIDRLRQHLQTHGRGSYPCQHCNKVFESSIHRRHHISKIHLKNGLRMTCPHCPERFKYYRNRVHHMATFHNVKNINCSCTFCVSSTKPTKLNKNTLKPFKCVECNKCFTRKHEMICHRVCHSGEKPFTCEICSKSYGRQRTLREHMRIHIDDRRFSCTKCGKTFIQKITLQNHMRVHFVHQKL